MIDIGGNVGDTAVLALPAAENKAYESMDLANWVVVLKLLAKAAGDLVSRKSDTDGFGY